MGEVYLATDTKLKRQVAVKILSSSLAADPDRLARFQREAEVLASLNHSTPRRRFTQSGRERWSWFRPPSAPRDDPAPIGTRATRPALWHRPRAEWRTLRAGAAV